MRIDTPTPSFILLAAVATLAGCSSHYVTPGGPAQLGLLASEGRPGMVADTDAGDSVDEVESTATPRKQGRRASSSGSRSEAKAPVDPAVAIAERMKLMPSATWPAGIALARVQASGYRSGSCAGVDRGSISIVSAGDLEHENDASTIAGWPSVRGFVRLTPILVPASGSAMLSLRQGAATMRADILALYTIDTDFRVDDADVGPLSIVTLGLAPTRNAVVSTTASIAFFDVRTGFCYGAAEGSATDDQIANAWTSSQAVDDARKRAERLAFERMLTEAGKAWQGISAQALATK